MHRALTFSGPGLSTAFTALFLALAFMVWPGSALPDRAIREHPPGTTGGSLTTLDPDGQLHGTCPLKHTDVAVEISGFIARTQVTQRFENPFEEKIEAVYTFPLPNRAAVNDMTLTVGERVIKGKIKRREEAQAIYEAARTGGRVAGLLDQERPNIFTQAVANIMPGEQVTVTISYVEMLQYADGAYELVFPMVVGPRYIPGEQAGGLAKVSHEIQTPRPRLGGGWSYDTDQVPDASRITPPITPPGTRAGHDISIAVSIDSGVALQSLHSPTHAVEVKRSSESRARITLKNETTIPNKDFILKYAVAGEAIKDAVLTHRKGPSGFFTLILQPPARVAPEQVTPKELVFVLDTSGSMSGFPIEKAKETMRLALAGLHPQDTFNLITFAGNTRLLFPRPVPATKENLTKAQNFLSSRHGHGGTEMMKAVRAALAPSDSREHVRIVCFMTDGYVGNDMAILAEMKKHPNARVFSFGIGSSVNRFLLDKMAELGRGEVEYVGLSDDGSLAAKRFHERVRSPLLTDITIDWGQLEVHDILPGRIPDLFDAKPLVITGRYSSPGKGIVRVSGKVAGNSISREIVVDLPVAEEQHEVVATLWARRKIAHLMNRDFGGIQQGTPKAEVKQAIVRLGLEHKLLTQYTSFVAVEEQVITAGGEPRRIDVPVELPDGVSYVMVGATADHGGQPARYRHASRQVMHTLMPTVPPMVGGGAKHMHQPAAESADAAVYGSASATDPRSKMDSALTALLHGSRDEAKFVKDDKVEIQIWLSDTSSETLAQLKRIGFELLHHSKTGKLVIGRIAIERLEDLARLQAVRYITPLRA